MPRALPPFAALAAALLATGANAGPLSLAFPEVDPSDLAAEQTTAAERYLTALEAHRVLEQDAALLFVDVRPVAEAERTGLAAGVDALVPLDAPEAFVERVAALVRAAGRGRDDAVVLICGHGVRSARAADLLTQAGYTDVWTVVEGMAGAGAQWPGWIAKGLPLRAERNRRAMR